MNWRSHPIGEAKRKREQAQDRLLACAGVQTPADKVQVGWNGTGAVTPMGQLAYFIELLTLTRLWERWRDGCRLHYMSPNAPDKTDVLGT